MNIGEKYYCSKCMRELDEEGICPYCKYDPAIRTESSTGSLEEGTLLQNGRYQIGAVIGSGGFGITYAAWDFALSKPVAVKEYYPNVLCCRDTSRDDEVHTQPEHDGVYRVGLMRFSREARILSTLQNVSGVVAVYDWFEGNNTAYIVMQLLRGTTLDQYVREHAVSPQQLLSMMRSIVDALILVHNQGILHRDISPDNILIQENDSLKLIDFGAATIDERRLLGKDQTVIFNRRYAPVEQYDENGLQGPWTDVYALSATLYALLTGKPPIESVARKGHDSLKTLSEQNVHIKRWQEKAIMDGMALQPEKRIQNMEIFRSILYHLPLPEQEKKRRRFIARVVTSAAAVSLASILLTINFTSGFSLGDHIWYSLRRDGFHAVSYSGKAESLSVPEKRLGIRVTMIDDGAFQSAEELKELTLPGSVHCVGALAFNECGNLKTVILREGVSQLLPQSFAGCRNMQAVYVPASLMSFSPETFSGAGNRLVLIGSADTPSARLADQFGLSYAQIKTTKEKEGVVITAYQTNHESVRIPDEIDGSPVIGIASGIEGVPVFPSSVASVELPKNLRQIGAYAFFETSIKEIVIPEGVEKIGEFAFAQSQLVSIHLPDSIREVGQGAFQTCIRLVQVSLSSSMERIPQGCFEGAMALSDVMIPTGITEVELLAFSRCEKLETLTLPKSVKTINRFAFQDCVSLRTLYWPESLQYVHPSALSGCAGALTLIGYDYAAYYADHFGYHFYDLRKPNLHMQITEKGNLIVDDAEENKETVLPTYAWNTVAKQILEASALRSKHVILPSETENIATKSFYANPYLERVTAPESLKRIGYYSFALCNNLKEVELCDGVEEIGCDAFLGCAALETIQIPDTVKDLRDGAFENCVNLSTANIPSSLVILENDVFANCGFENFTIPGTVAKCRTSFYGCKRLKSVTVEEGVRTLWGTFANCEMLEEVVLPATMNQISRSTFLGCSRLRDVWVYSTDAEFDYVYPAISHYESEGYRDGEPQGKKMFLESGDSKWLFGDSPALTLHGYRGSTVQVYAQEHGIAFEEILDEREEDHREKIKFISLDRIYTDEELRRMIVPRDGDSVDLCWGKFRYAYGYGFEDLMEACLDAYVRTEPNYTATIARATKLFLEQRKEHRYMVGAPIVFFENFQNHPALQVGDIIVEIDGQRLNSNDDIRDIKRISGKDYWEYTVLRENREGKLERIVTEVDSNAPLHATQDLSPQTFENP